MKIISLPKRHGKTMKMIEESAKTNTYIVCPGMERAKQIARKAKDMGKNILYPITIHEIIQYQKAGMRIKGVLIDDLDLCMQAICPYEIKQATITTEA